MILGHTTLGNRSKGVREINRERGRVNMRIHVVTGAAKYNGLFHHWEHFPIGLTSFQAQVAMGKKRRNKWEIFLKGFQLPLVKSPFSI